MPLVALAAGLLLAQPCAASPGEWEYTGSMKTVREHQTATFLRNGKVLVAGGFGTRNSLATAELYDSASGTWHVTGRLENARSNASATLLRNGTVLVVGGIGRGSVYLSSTELYDAGQ